MTRKEPKISAEARLMGIIKELGLREVLGRLDRLERGNAERQSEVRAVEIQVLELKGLLGELSLHVLGKTLKGLKVKA